MLWVYSIAGYAVFKMSRSKLFGIGSHTNIFVAPHDLFLQIGVCGCDHHGHPDARLPCGCDFCKMDKPVSDKILRKRQRSQRAQGLTLRNGPDPRSLNPMAGSMAEVMRGFYGMDT